MNVIITIESGAVVEEVYWIDTRNMTAGVGLRRDDVDGNGGQSYWADTVGFGELRMRWARGGTPLTKDERIKQLETFAQHVYE